MQGNRAAAGARGREGARRGRRKRKRKEEADREDTRARVGRWGGGRRGDNGGKGDEDGKRVAGSGFSLGGELRAGPRGGGEEWVACSFGFGSVDGARWVRSTDHRTQTECVSPQPRNEEWYGKVSFKILELFRHG